MNKPKKPWVEKYRPSTLHDVVHQNQVVSLLKKSIVVNDFPNLLFYGPPGTGKTSSILAFARTVFGARFEGSVLHLNASDERGISVIRERVGRFAQSVANLKLVILDEADSMTGSAQSCLRRTMEIYSKTTRFCLICNYISRIIEPIASRCSKFRFEPISTSLMLERLMYICENENIKFTDNKVLEHLISFCDGDLRQAITKLQSAHQLMGQNTPLDLDLIHEVSGVIPRRYINRFVAVCKSKSPERMEEFIRDLLNEGFIATQFLSQIHDWLLTQSALSDTSLAKIMPALALAEHRFSDGSDEYIQLLYVASVIMKNFDSSTQSQQ